MFRCGIIRVEDAVQVHCFKVLGLFFPSTVCASWQGEPSPGATGMKASRLG